MSFMLHLAFEAFKMVSQLLEAYHIAATYVFVGVSWFHMAWVSKSPSHKEITSCCLRKPHVTEYYDLKEGRC